MTYESRSVLLKMTTVWLTTPVNVYTGEYFCRNSHILDIVKECYNHVPEIF